MALDPVPAYSAFRCGPCGFAYNEAAFRHFLWIERRRAQQSRRSVLLILVTPRIGTGGRRPMLDGRSAASIFHALGGCIREVDLVGWYREGVVAGAVIPLTAAALSDVPKRFAERLNGILHAEMGPEYVARVRVRVVTLSGRVRH